MRVLVYDRNDSPLFEITPDELYGLVRDEQLDGPRSLTITTTHVLQKNMRVLVCDATERWHEYVVEGCDEEHGKGNRPIGTYWCSWSMQHDLELTVVSKMPSGGVSTALAAVLSGTKRWTAGTVTKVKTASASMYEMGGWEAVAVMCDAWECEVDDEITVDTAGVVSRSMAALEHVGSSTATRRFDYGIDMKSIKRSVDEEPVFARVIPKGMGEETDTGYYGRRIGIESVNGGVPWLENATTAPYLRVPDGEGGYEYPTRYVVNDELDDPADLKAWALANLDEWTAPKVTYGADLCQFKQAGLDANGVALGDEVQVVDRAFGEDGLRIAARVVSLRINELDPADMALVIGDAPANMATGLTTLAGTLSDVKSTVEVMNGGSMTTADYLSRLVDRLNYAINAQGGYSYLVPGLGMVTYDVPVADPADPVEAHAVVEIRGGTVRIADSKNQDGTWQYKTVFTSGHLAADVVTAANITAGYIGSSSGTFIDLDNGIAQFGDTSGIWTQVAQTAFNVRQGATDVLSTFGATSAQIGKSSSTHVNIDADSFDISSELCKILSIGVDEDDELAITAYGGEIVSGSPVYDIKMFSLQKFDSQAGFGTRGFALYTGDIILADLTTRSTTKSFAGIYGQADVQNAGSSIVRIVSNSGNGASTSDRGYSFLQVTGNELFGRGFSNVRLDVGSSGSQYVDLTSSRLKTNTNIEANNTLTLGTNTSAEENGIRVKGGGTRNAWLLRNISAANGDGDAVLLGNGGMTIIGGGEAHNSLWNALGVSAGTERLDLASDNAIYLWANCNTIADRVGARFTNNGDFLIEGNGSYWAKSQDIDRDAAAPSGTQYGPYYRMRDADNEDIGYVRTFRNTNGAIGIQVAAVNEVSGSSTSNTLTIRVEADGTPSVGVTNAAQWRSALGIGTSGAFPVTKAQGGTGKTNTDTTYYGAKSLFSGTATTGTVTLSETAANYSMLLIQYRDNDSNYSSKLIIGPNGKRVVLDMVYGVSGVGNLKSRTVTISGTSITTVSGSTMDAAHNGGADTTNHIYITQVWGWK